MSNIENNNIRPTQYSERARKWGLVMYDIDAINYYPNRSVAILEEHKHALNKSGYYDLTSDQIQRLKIMANDFKQDVAALFVIDYYNIEYNGEFKNFGYGHKYYVIPLNDFAKKYFIEGFYTEYTFVCQKYKLTGKPMTDAIKNNLLSHCNKKFFINQLNKYNLNILKQHWRITR